MQAASDKKPILFACSGCSNAGQLANDVAHQLDLRGVAEMSCLAGIGAAKPLFLKKLQQREVWSIDGCPIHCSLGVFDQVREHIDVHIRLHDMGVKKNSAAPTGEALDALIDDVLRDIARQRLSAVFLSNSPFKN